MSKQRKRASRAAMKASPAPEPDSLPVTPEQLARVVVTSPPKDDWDYQREAV
ncbi:hypothetical protein [Candidatus Poriferisodalis sp.]|uniref:hypothetical protein n=1 Tax=Candidatus Poriferisodalis sp. TaxID=3101277 RepID=UPI003D0E8565